MIAVYPGTFDPITNGHIDIIQRAAKISEKLYVALAVNINKNSWFTVEERLLHIKEATKNIENVFVVSFSRLLVEFAEDNKIDVIIRGLRSTKDFEFELQMAYANSRLAKNIETLFIPTNMQYSYLSSSAVKEIVSFGGNIDEMVPDFIKHSIEKYLRSI